MALPTPHEGKQVYNLMSIAADTFRTRSALATPKTIRADGSVRLQSLGGTFMLACMPASSKVGKLGFTPGHYMCSAVVSLTSPAAVQLTDPQV